MEYNNNFALRLKEYMDTHGLSFREMEQKTGIPAQTLNRYVLGQRTPKIDVIPDLAAKLNVSDSWLMGIEEEEQKEKPVNLDELSESKKKLIEQVLTLPEKDAELFFHMMKAFHERNNS